MEDDLAFGASVWGAPDDPVHNPSTSTTHSHLTSGSTPSADEFNEFDDIGQPTPTLLVDGADDDDFGDFGDAEESTIVADFGEDTGFTQPRIPIASANWEPLRLDPIPSRADLQAQVNDILGPIWADDDISSVTTGENIRQAEGISQILITSESRDLYNVLFQSPPVIKPPNWTRSRIRRQHLITLGIPVNLDEVLPHANGKPLPPLQISTRPASESAPPGPSHKTVRGTHSRSGTPQPTNTGADPSNVSQLGLGPKPDLDEERISELLALNSETLPLLPLPILEAHLAALRTQTANTSSLLTHLLQTREALQQDSETYNGLIAELVSEAQKVKTGPGKGRATPRNTTPRNSTSMR